MTDSALKSKRTITAAAVNTKPKHIATASTCIGKVDVSMYPPTRRKNRFVVTLTTIKGEKHIYKRWHSQIKQANLSKRLKLTNEKRNFSLIQTSDDKFELKHIDLPDCQITIVDYAVNPPATKYNGIGLIVASIVEVNANGYEPIENTQGQEEEEDDDEEQDLLDQMGSWNDYLNEPAEVCGGNQNVWVAIDNQNAGQDGEEDTTDNDDGENDWFWNRWGRAVRDWLITEH